MCYSRGNVYLTGVNTVDLRMVLFFVHQLQKVQGHI